MDATRPKKPRHRTVADRPATDSGRNRKPTTDSGRKRPVAKRSESGADRDDRNAGGSRSATDSGRKRPVAATATGEFAALGVPRELVAALANSGISSPFPIQEATIPGALRGRDILGRGRTGSGKTLAFAIPVLARLAGRYSDPKRPRAVVLAPTRELADQINATIAPLAQTLDLSSVAIYGGAAPGPQIRALKGGVDVVVATPGRLDDHIRSGHASLDHVQIAVIDEADHMADLGFLPDVRALLDRMPNDGQRMLFSATLDHDVDVLVRQYLDAPLTHSIEDDGDNADVEHHVLRVELQDRFAVLADLAQAPGQTIVFTKTRIGAAKLTEQFTNAGVAAVDLHGDLSQSVRARNLRAFSQGRATTLVATDIAARGIHVDDVARVVHADLPAEHKSYVHRSGRTARAGAKGTVVTMAHGRQARMAEQLALRAGVSPTVTRVKIGHPLLLEIAPGERVHRTVAPEPGGDKGQRSSRKRQGSGSASRQRHGSQSRSRSRSRSR